MSVVEDLDLELENVVTDYRQCQRELPDGSRCPNPLPEGAIRTQRYCPDHQPKKKKDLGSPSQPGPKSTRTVNLNLPKVSPSKADSDAAKVEEGVKQLLSLIATGLVLVDEVCAGAFFESIPSVARQLGELSKFQPILKKIFTPGESTGEALAWVGLVIALSPAILAILTHHHVLKPETLQKIGSVVSMGAQFEADDAGA